MFYLPQKFRHNAVRLSKIFKNVFCEIAVPTMLVCLDDIEHWEFLRGHWGFQLQSGSYPAPEYVEESDWIHPLKFSKEKERVFAQKVVEAHTKAKVEEKR